ncbi:hypothetical protein MRX96_055865 [Rhipicephalus microplus]
MEGPTTWTSDSTEEDRSSDVHPVRSSVVLGATSDPLWNCNQNFANIPSGPPSVRSDGRSTMGSYSTVRRNSLTSRFYCNPRECQTECCHGASEVVGNTTTFSVKQSSQLPLWLWLFLARCLRVPLPGRRACRFIPSIGLLLQALTVLSCIGLCLVHIAYEVRLIMVSRGEAKTLLFSHPAFIKDIRMHSKTLLKINAAALAIILGAVFLAVNAYSSRIMIQGETCVPIGFPRAICTMHFLLHVIYSIFSLMWHGLVCMVLVSVARTHTIGIRRFVKELEADAVSYEACNAKQYYGSPLTAEDICEESVWIENKMSESGSYIADDCYGQGSSLRHVQLRSYEDGPHISVLSGTYDADVTRSADLSVAPQQAPRSLSIAEILHVYWKVSCRLRLTGRALQRWVGSLIALVVFWCSSQLVTWLNHSPTVWEVVQFVCPLTLLLVVTSCIAEVNLEGSRMLKCIRPTEERNPNDELPFEIAHSTYYVRLFPKLRNYNDRRPWRSYGIRFKAHNC